MNSIFEGRSLVRQVAVSSEYKVEFVSDMVSVLICVFVFHCDFV